MYVSIENGYSDVFVSSTAGLAHRYFRGVTFHEKINCLCIVIVRLDPEIFLTLSSGASVTFVAQFS